jgi:hypothetical protein
MLKRIFISGLSAASAWLARELCAASTFFTDCTETLDTGVPLATVRDRRRSPPFSLDGGRS